MDCRPGNLSKSDGPLRVQYVGRMDGRLTAVDATSPRGERPTTSPAPWRRWAFNQLVLQAFSRVVYNCRNHQLDAMPLLHIAVVCLMHHLCRSRGPNLRMRTTSCEL